MLFFKNAQEYITLDLPFLFLAVSFFVHPFSYILMKFLIHFAPAANCFIITENWYEGISDRVLHFNVCLS